MNKDLNRKVLVNVPNFYVKDEDFDENSKAPIDILIAESIEILNKKGYKTKFCCSGHLEVDGTTDEWISFDVPGREQIIKEMNENIRKFGTHAYVTFDDFYENLPYLYGWILDNSGKVENCGSSIYCHIKNPTYRKLKRIHSRFRNWCKKLPKLN